MVVADSTPLIHLAHAGQLTLLRRYYGAVCIPPAVYQEIYECPRPYPNAGESGRALPDWIRVHPMRDQSAAIKLAQEEGLDRGELEAIVLTLQENASTLVMDDHRGVVVARGMQLPVVRTASLLTRCKVSGLIGAVRPYLDELRASGFWLRESDYRIILRQAGEDA